MSTILILACFFVGVLIGQALGCWIAYRYIIR